MKLVSLTACGVRQGEIKKFQPICRLTSSAAFAPIKEYLIFLYESRFLLPSAGRVAREQPSRIDRDLYAIPTRAAEGRVERHPGRGFGSDGASGASSPMEKLALDGT